MDAVSLRAALNRSQLMQLCRESKDGTLNLVATFNDLGNFRPDQAKDMVIQHLLNAGISITNAMQGDKRMLLYGSVDDFLILQQDIYGFFMGHFDLEHNGMSPS